MNAYSPDLRIRVIKAYINKEGTQEEIGKRFSVSRNTVYNWVKAYKETGKTKPKEYKSGRKSKISGNNLLVLKKITEDYPDATLEEYSEYYYKQTGIKVSTTCVIRALKRLGLTRKKSKFMLPKEILKE
jgi:transposase